MKIMTLGKGFISSHLPYECILDRIPVNSNIINNILSYHQPDVLINCIGRTGIPNIDYCESHKEETIEANTTIPILLSEVCKKLNIYLIHIGSGCIFFKSYDTWDKQWREDDIANPQSFYSKTKYATDLVLGQMDHVTTLRIRMPISNRNVPRNLINKLKNIIKL